MGIKSYVKEWMSEMWDYNVVQPISKRTEQVEQAVATQYNKAQNQINKPFDYYWSQNSFYRGLFWIAIAVLIVLWMLSGS